MTKLSVISNFLVKKLENLNIAVGVGELIQAMQGKVNEIIDNADTKANVPVWVDIDFPQVIRTTGANVPAIATLQGNITMPQWAVNNFNSCEVGEYIHGAKEGNICYWHAHIITGGTNTTDRYINIECEYTWANVNSALAENVVATSGDFLIPANTPAKTHLIVPIATFTPTGGKIGAHIKPRLRRIASTGTAPTSDFFCEMLQLHVLCDTIGSTSTTYK